MANVRDLTFISFETEDKMLIIIFHFNYSIIKYLSSVRSLDFLFFLAEAKFYSQISL